MKTANYPGSKLKDFIIGFFGFYFVNFVLGILILFLAFIPNSKFFGILFLIFVNIYSGVYFFRKGKKFLVYGEIAGIILLIIFVVTFPGIPGLT